MIRKRSIDVLFIILFLSVMLVGTNKLEADLSVSGVIASASGVSQQATVSLKPIAMRRVVNDTCNDTVTKNLSNCFYGSVKHVVHTLEKAALVYVRLCALETKPRLTRLVDLAGKIGFTEGYTKANGNSLPANAKNAIASLSSYSEFKFVGYLKELQASFQEDVARGKLVDRLWGAISDELDAIIRQGNYPFFLRKNVWHLMQNMRIVNMLRTLYGNNLSHCLPNTWPHVIHFYEIGSNPNFVTIFKQGKPICTTNSHTVQITPQHFTNGGIVFTFWGKSNLGNIVPSGKTQNVLTGYLNNRLVYEWTLIDDCQTSSAQVIHEIKILNEVIQLRSESRCADHYFGVIAIQKACDKYAVTISVRFLASNTRKTVTRYVFADNLENTQFKFNQATTSNHNLYMNIPYSVDKELILMSYSTTPALLQKLQERTKCDNQNGKCLYSDLKKCVVCAAPLLNHKGTCVTQCPDNFFNNGQGYCRPCAPQCGTCTGPKNGNCKTCVLGLSYNNGLCVPTCPAHLAVNKLGKCVPCGKKCVVCRDEKTCSKCAADHYLKDGTCVNKCGVGFFPSYTPNVCNRCSTGCAECLNGNKCNVCEKGFYLRNGQCVRACGNGYWTNEVTRTCVPCLNGCATCKDAKTCITCVKGLNLSKKTQTCVNKCPNGQVMINGACAPCADKNCLRCSATNTKECKVCNGQTYNKKGVCVPACGEGFYADSKRNCVPCVNGCKLCTKEKCLQCYSPKVVFKDIHCLTHCPDGYVRSGNVCVRCNEPTKCRKCEAKSLSTCTRCYKGEYLFAGKCVKTCPPRFFPSGANCKPCQKGCLTCVNANSCKVCDKDWFLKNNGCVDCCGVGYTEVKNTCQRCTVHNCDVCNPGNLGRCEKCIEGTYLYNNVCHKVCPLGTFANKKNGVCEPCGQNCALCTNNDKCVRCKIGFVLQDKKCQSFCNDGFVPVNGICTPCKNNRCRKCGPGLIRCTECPLGSLLYKGDCLKTCPDGTFANKGRCTPCTQPCKECSNASSCTACPKGFFLFNGKCTDQCPDFQTMHNGRCVPCKDAGCQKCSTTDPTTCLVCCKEHVLHQGKCLNQCHKGFYEVKGVCHPCKVGCARCDDTKCHECNVHLYLYNGSCVKTCPAGTVADNGKCIKCNVSCKSCAPKDPNTCTQCPQPYKLYNGQCLNACPVGTWATALGTCAPCQVNKCGKCTGGVTCSECLVGYVLQNNKCIPAPCSKGYVQLPGTRQCVPCQVQNCEKCPANNVKTCTTCTAPHLLVNGNKCVSPNCPVGFFKIAATRTCTPCSSHCNQCQDATNCVTCQNNYFLFQGRCRPDCPSGYVKSNGKCLPCDTKNCATCTANGKTCIKCNKPLFLNDNTCVPECPAGRWSLLRKCVPCSPGCAECCDGTRCDTCKDPLKLTSDGKCVDSCPAKTVLNNGKCSKCLTGKKCLKCDVKNHRQCVQCIAGHFLKNGKCVPECGPGFTQIGGNCQPCGPHCNTCSLPSTCQKCDAGYFMQGNKCVPNCPVGSHNVNGKCNPCSDRCARCDADKCTQCNKGAYLHNGVCVNVCPRGTFVSINTCKPCGSNCLDCKTAATCTVCKDNFFLFNGQCIPNCKVGTVQVAGSCAPCGTNCNVCNKLNVKECITCATGTVLHQGQCVPKCPLGFFNNNGQCSPCIKGCDICNNAITCQKCAPKLNLSNDQKACTNICPDGFAPGVGKCAPCQVASCKNCSGVDNKLCITCTLPGALYDQKCIPTCPPKLWYRSKAGKCERCPAGCYTCSYDRCITCLDGFQLVGKTCQNVCAANQIKVDGVCQNCADKNCQTCDKTKTKCLDCKSGFVIDKVNGVDTCVECCGEGWFNNKGRCDSCVPRCSQCFNKSECAVCEKGLVLQNGQCVVRCLPGYVQRDLKCHKCSDPSCLRCDPLTQNTCSLCDKGYSLKNGKCVPDCGSGYYRFAVTATESVCKPCDQRCSKCDGPLNCKECNKGFNNKKGVCVPNCPLGWTLNSRNKCVQCWSKPCQKCDVNNPGICVVCQPGYFLKGNQCVKVCGPGYRVNGQTCVPCADAACVQCNVAVTNCNKCQFPLVVLNGNCVKSCPVGMSSKNGICTKCDEANCEKCHPERTDKCSDCKKGYLLTNAKKCVPKCPAGTYSFQGVKCLPCKGNCATCSGPFKCETCIKGFTLNSKKQCTDGCANGQAKLNEKCAPCADKACGKCTGKSNATCLKCINGFLYKGLCYPKCPEGTYQIAQTCRKCSPHCLTCKNGQSCTKCNPITVLQGKHCVRECYDGYQNVKGVCTKCKNFGRVKRCPPPPKPPVCRPRFYLHNKNCVDHCPKGTMPDANRNCQPCGPNCIQCSKKNTCSRCIPTHVLLNGLCLPKCPSGFVNVIGVCQPCNQKACLSCRPQNRDHCTGCAAPLIAHKGKCVPSCPGGTFRNGNKCSKCDPSCATCSKKGQCITCRPQFTIQKGKCVAKCQPGKVLVLNECIACQDANCKMCRSNNINKCITCNEGWTLHRGECIKTCPNGFYMTKDRRCAPCSKFCDRCNEKTCLQCHKGFVPFKRDPKNCVPCRDVLHVVEKGQCTRCKPAFCLKCVKGDSQKCQLCHISKVLVNGKCVDSCPKGLFRVGQTCKTCSPNCAVCRNPHSCVNCKAPYFLFNGQCVTKCPAGFIFNGKNKCQRCAQRQCLECQKNLTTCIKCAPPSILYKGTCNHHCPNGTALVKGTCTPCKAGCKLCTAAKCYVCAAGLKLRGNECVKECGLGYLTKGNKCVPCLDSKCAQCNPVNKCTACKAPNVLNPNGSCTIDCKSGFYKVVANNTCAKCDKGCEICSGVAKCSRCEKGLFLHEGKCVSKCPDRFSPTESRCAPCAVANCQKCQRDVLKCQQCDPKFFTFNGKCIPSCPAGTYASKGKNCKKCDARCDLCTSYTNCTKCKPEFHLNKGKCETITCSDGKVLINDKCVSCADPNCKACLTNVNQCVKCKSPFILHDSGCVSSCPNGYYADKNGVCQPCSTGCEVCKSQNVCTKCSDGFNLWKDNCVKTCPLGYFGDCKEKVCKKCNDACEVCTDASSVNCKHCAKGFFLSGNTCVKADNCRKGTYPDDTTRKCATCKIPFCSVCLDFDTCEKCINGFQVNKNGGCSEAKSFINIIPQNPKLLSQITYPLLRASEVVNFNTNLKGTGIGSTTVSYTFFLRRITQYDVETTVFQTTSKDPAHNVRFYIHNDNCHFSVNGDSHKVSNCAYNTIRNWHFYTIVLNRNGPNSSVQIHSGRHGETPLLNFNSTVSPTIHWLSRSSNIEFNDKGRGNAYELANFNVFDYAPNRNDTTTFAKARPVTCDYACVDCREKCHRCAGDVAPVNGTCPAVYLPLASDLQIFTNKPSVSLRSKVSKRLDSKRYAFTTWFFSTRPKNNDYTIGQLHYPYQPSTPIIAVRVVSNNLQVQVNSQVWNTNAKVSPNKWYHVGVTVNKNGQVGYWLVPRKGKPFSGLQKLNTPVRLLTEDASFSVNGATPPNNFQGSFFDGRLYVNNIPDQPRVTEHFNGLRCPKNCLVCNQAMRCVRCTNGFQLNKDYQCVDNDLGARILGLDKYSFWKNDTYTINVPNKFFEKPFSLSFWYRKKIHSVPEKIPQAFFNVLSYAPSNAPNTLYPLVQETITNNPKYTSNFTIGGDCGPSTKFVENFSNEVYSWIHFVLNFYPNKGLVTFNVKNDNQISFVGNYTYNATKFVFGDPKGRDMNFEIGHAFFYSKPISESNLPKVRQTEPRDCDASCKKCDYFTGKCQECKIRRPGINAVCPNLLLGYESAYTYNVQTFDRTRAKMFATSLKNSFTRDVNSLEYSVIGYFRLFDLKITDQYQNNRFALFTVTNRRDGKKSPSNHLISLHIRTTKGRPHFIWVNNDHDKVVETEIQGLKVKPNQWIFVYATINVIKKRLDFAFRVENKESKTQVGAIQFKNFPEKLQERGSLILFGIGQRLPKDYKTLNAQFFYFYASPNLRWNPVMVDKYRKAFPVKPDPKCTANCLRCIHDYSRKVNVCLKCKTGFAVSGDKCVKNLQSDYIIFSDQLNNHFLPPKTDVNLPAQALPATKNTFAFYFQRNYMPRSQGGNRVILQAGQLTVSLHITQSTSATLTFSVKGVADTVSFSEIDSFLNVDYGWHLVLINFDTNNLKVTIRNELGKTIGQKSISWTNVALRITSLSFNSLHKEVSIYGPHMMLHYHYAEPLFGYPHVNCGIDCNACVNDKCVDCQYGFDIHGRCKNKPLKPFGFKVQQGSKYENRFPISKDLGNFRFLRSHSWSIYFTFQSKGDLNNLVGRTLFRVQNSHTKEFNTNLINDHIFSVKFHKNRSFFISVNTRHYQNHNKSPQGWTTKSLKPSDNNKNYFVGIVVDSDVDKIHFYVYNSPTNFIKQSFSLEGVLDNIINKATLIFGEGFGNDKKGILVDNTRFYYEKILGFPLFEKLSRRYVFHYQEACSSSTRNQCKKCAQGFLVNNGAKANYCSPTKVGYSWYLNHVRQFDEVRANYTVPSPVLVRDPLDSYTFSFWYRRTSFENDPHGVANIGGVVLIHYDSNTLTFNVEEFNCTVVGTIRVPNVYAKTDGLDWLHITVSVNVKDKKFQVVIHNVRTGANRYVTAAINVKSLGTIQQQSITWSLNTNPNCTDLAWSFEVSSFVFLPNWYPKDTSIIAIYRIRRPINCESKCKTTCDANVLCPNANRFVTQINVPSVSLPDVTKACDVPLYRNLTSYFGNFPLAAPSFNKYLVAFELNIPALQSSTYTTNKNFLLNLNNDVQDCDLDFTHVLTDNVVKYGVLTVEYRGNALRFYIGGSKANTYAAFYDFVFESNNFKGISRVNVEFYVNAEENYGKLIIYIDDLSASYEIKTTYPPQPITRDTVVYNHPAITNTRINVHNARFNYDFYYNIFPKSWAPTFASNLCKSRAHCEKCSIIPKATSLHCHRCAKGYKLINNICLDESSFGKKQ